MRRKNFIIILLVTFSMVLYIQRTVAFSEQQDLDGKWLVDMWVIGDLENEYDISCRKTTILDKEKYIDSLAVEERLEHFELKIGPDGIIEKSVYLSCSGILSEIIGGYLTINPDDGSLEGEIETLNRRLHVTTGAIIGDDQEHMALGVLSD